MGGPWSEWIPASLHGRQAPRNVYGIYQFGATDEFGEMEILYIGRARTGQTTLYDRIRRHLQSYGSNGIFEMSKDPNVELYVQWKCAGLGEDPAHMESAALETFTMDHGRLPRMNRKTERHQRFSDSLLVRLGISGQTADMGLLGAFCLLSGIVSSGVTIVFHGAWGQ